MSKNAWWQYARIVTQQIPVWDIPKDFAKREVALVKHIWGDTLFMFLELDGEYIFPSKFGPVYPPLRKRNLLKELVTECHDNGIRFVAAFMGQHCQTKLAKKHPDWVFKGFRDVKEKRYVSMGPTCLCLNSPYRRILQGMVREGIVDYGVDGIYFDGVYYPPPFCFCAACRKKYREMFGRNMPLRMRDPRRVKLGEETMVSWSREIRDLINNTKPDVCYALDCHATIIGHSDSREYIHKTYDYVDVRIQECYPEIIQEQPYYAEMENRAIAAETGKTVWWAKWIARNPDANVISNPPAALRQWGAGALATKSPVLFVLQRTNDFDGRSIAPMREIGRLWQRASADMRDAQRVAPIALFHSVESKLQRLPVRVREHRRYFEGWYLALNNQHIPFEVVSEAGLSIESLKKYSALILPNVRYMSDGIVDIIRSYAKSGGALIASEFTSLSDEAGRDRRDFALADVFGLHYTGETDGTHCGPRIFTQYYRAFTRHPISKGLDRDFYSFRGGLRFPTVKLSAGTRAVFNIARYDPDLLKTGKYFVQYPTKRKGNVVLAARDKAARVVAIPAPLDGAYWEHGWPELVEIMRNAVRWTLSGELPIETDAEENVWMNLYGNERRKSWTLHLNNQGVNNQYSVGFNCCLVWDKPEPQTHGHPVRKCFRTGGFSVLFKGITSGKLGARSLTGAKVMLKKERGGWCLKHPGISEYDVIVFGEPLERSS